jgi:hypothetical protein
MMRLAEGGAMFSIARFEKRLNYLQGTAKSPNRLQVSGMSNPDSEAQPPGGHFP